MYVLITDRLCPGARDTDSMKVIIKFRNHTEIVENVSVDEKCFPLVGGVHPYPEASQQDSHLANQSSLWFKTLAIDCIFVDCDRSEVHWFPMVEEVNADVGVILRKSRPNHHECSFIKSVAKPLFEDAALYDMDPSLKGMMLTCSDAMKKLAQKKMGKADFNRAIASILHVYILPSISFSPEDMYCLSRTRCLIEHRLNNAENMITSVVESIDRLDTCLCTLRTNMLFRENLENEDYLLTCNRNFLEVFVKNLEEVLVNLNLGLEAQQSKVNWAKQHEDDDKVTELKVERDKLHSEIIKLIKVREAIRNVTVRKEFVPSKKRKKKAEVASCFHDVFVEVMRRLDAENKTLERLCQDKLNISAAREATMSAIFELENNNRVSERHTKFEPEDFVDYSINAETGSKKSDLWPTFQERVSAILERSSSNSRLLHLQGCEALSSSIDLALSEYNMAVLNGVQSRPKIGNKLNVVEPEVEMRTSSPALSSRRSKNLRSTVCTYNDKICIHEATLNMSFHDLDLSKQDFVNDISHKRDASQEELSENLEQLIEVDPKDDSTENPEGNSADSFESTPNLDRNRYRYRINEKLALSTLLKSVDDLKQAMQIHFRDMVSSLIQELEAEKDLGLERADKKELLWKSYERIFMKNEVERLTKLYDTLLRPGSERTFRTLSTSPLQVILNEDKILHFFYGSSPGTSPVDVPPAHTPYTNNKFSMAKTLSEPSLDVRNCPLEDLYTLVNADSSDIQRRFHLESSGEDSDLPSSSGSSGASSSSFRGNGMSEGSSPRVTVHDLSAEFSRGVGKKGTSFKSQQASSLTSSNQGKMSESSSQLESSTESKQCGILPDEILMLPGEEEDEGKGHPMVNSDQTQAQYQESAASSYTSVTSLSGEENSKPSERLSREVPVWSSLSVLSRLEAVLTPFRKSVGKCLEAPSLMDKMRYMGRAIQALNRQVWLMMGEEEQASCDDILSMLVLALCHMSEDVFIGLYVNVRMLMDIWPPFLDGTLWNCSLVNLYASYDFLFTHSVCERAVRDYSGSLRIKF